jgi:hypothetical protein
MKNKVKKKGETYHFIDRVNSGCLAELIREDAWDRKGEFSLNVNDLYHRHDKICSLE